MGTVPSFVLIAACVTVAQPRAVAQDKPMLQAIAGFMVKGVFTELDRELLKRRISLADLETSHFDGKSTDIRDILQLMARSEKLRSRVDEPLVVRGEIPVTLPPNTTGDEAYTACFYAFTSNGLVLAGDGDELILVRPESRPALPKAERPWNRERVLPIRLFRLGYLKSDLVLAEYRDKLGTKGGRAILEAKSNVVIVADKPASLEKLGRYIDAETLQAMGVPAAAGHSAAEGLRPPNLGAIAGRENIHFYLLAYARARRIPLSGAKKEGVFDRHYPEADIWVGERGYRLLETEYKRVNEYVQLANNSGPGEWPIPDDERTLSPANQKKLEIHFGVITPEPQNAPTPKRKKAARPKSQQRE